MTYTYHIKLYYRIVSSYHHHTNSCYHVICKHNIILARIPKYDIPRRIFWLSWEVLAICQVLGILLAWYMATHSNSPRQSKMEAYLNDLSEVTSYDINNEVWTPNTLVFKVCTSLDDDTLMEVDLLDTVNYTWYDEDGYWRPREIVEKESLLPYLL